MMRRVSSPLSLSVLVGFSYFAAEALTQQDAIIESANIHEISTDALMTRKEIIDAKSLQTNNETRFLGGPSAPTSLDNSSLTAWEEYYAIRAEDSDNDTAAILREPANGPIHQEHHREHYQAPTLDVFSGGTSPHVDSTWEELEQLYELDDSRLRQQSAAFLDTYAPDHKRPPTKLATMGSSSSSNSNNKGVKRTAWEEFYELQNADHQNQTAVLLEHFQCPMYSDEHGINSSNEGSFARIPDSEETYNLFEDAYFAAYGMDRRNHPKSENMQKEGSSASAAAFDPHRGMLVPFEVKYQPTIGRGLYATSFIPKGTKVWSGTNTVAFPRDYVVNDIEATGSTDTSETDVGVYSAYRRFLEYLHDHRGTTTTTKGSAVATAADQNSTYDWACDALMWTYDGHDDNDDNVVCVNFDHGALFNDARDNATLANLNGKNCNDVVEEFPRGVPDGTPLVLPPPNITCMCYDLYADRDIEIGEELRYYYGYFDDDEDEDEYEDDDLVDCDDENDPECFYAAVTCNDKNDPDCKNFTVVGGNDEDDDDDDEGYWDSGVWFWYCDDDDDDDCG